MRAALVAVLLLAGCGDEDCATTHAGRCGSFADAHVGECSAGQPCSIGDSPCPYTNNGPPVNFCECIDGAWQCDPCDLPTQSDCFASCGPPGDCNCDQDPDCVNGHWSFYCTNHCTPDDMATSHD